MRRGCEMAFTRCSAENARTLPAPSTQLTTSPTSTRVRLGGTMMAFVGTISNTTVLSTGFTSLM